MKAQVENLLYINKKDVDLFEIRENAKIFESEFLKKRAEKRRNQKKGPHEVLSSSSDEEDFFRAAADLKYSNIEWKDIQHTRLGR